MLCVVSWSLVFSVDLSHALSLDGAAVGLASSVCALRLSSRRRLNRLVASLTDGCRRSVVPRASTRRERAGEPHPGSDGELRWAALSEHPESETRSDGLTETRRRDDVGRNRTSLQTRRPRGDDSGPATSLERRPQCAEGTVALARAASRCPTIPFRRRRRRRRAQRRPDAARARRAGALAPAAGARADADAGARAGALRRARAVLVPAGPEGELRARAAARRRGPARPARAVLHRPPRRTAGGGSSW